MSHAIRQCGACQAQAGVSIQSGAVVVTAAVLLAHVAPVLAQERPSALRAFESARREIVSGRILWDVRDERWDADERLQFKSSYARDGGMLFTHLGNKDGWTRFHPQSLRTGQFIPISKQKVHLLQNEEGWWQYREGEGAFGCVVASFPERAPLDKLKEIRAVGNDPPPEHGRRRDGAGRDLAG